MGLTRVSKDGYNRWGCDFGVDVAGRTTNAMGKLPAVDVVQLLPVVVAEEGMLRVLSGVPFEELGDGFDLPRLDGGPGREELGRRGARHVKDEPCLESAY